MSTFFPWKPEYETGIAEIDRQHKKLVNMLDGLYDAMQAGMGKAVLDKALADLVSYSVTHFETEERLMRQAAYPGLAAHKIEHDQFTQKVLTFQNQFRNGSAGLSVAISNFLRDWLINHIRGTDFGYRQYLKDAGIL